MTSRSSTGRRLAILISLACLCLGAPVAAQASAGGRPAGVHDITKRAHGQNYAGCIQPHYGMEGPITASAPPSWTCAQVGRFWKRADNTNGLVHTFAMFGYRWQCLTVGRPDHGQHTTLGCFHVHWKSGFHGNRPPGKPVVRFFLPFPAS